MIKLGPFGGMIPRTGVRLLPDTGAQIAANVKLQSGEIRPLRDAGSPVLPTSPKTMPPLSIFRARDGLSSSAWFTWPIDVDCVRVPLSTDVESRFCWTGDGPPKMAVYSGATGGGANNYPLLANEFTLGVPTPQTLPTVSPSGGSGSTVTRFYRYTFMTALGEESSPSPVSLVATGKIDGTWAISAMDTAPANTGSGTAAYASVTTFTNAASALHWLRVGDEIYFTAGVGISTTLKHTVASIPTPSSFTVTGDYAAATAWARKTNWNTSGMVKYLYRTTGSSGAFQLVNSTGIAVATTTYNDTLSDSLIAGDDMVSDGWVPPPVGLTGLCVHPSGALVGFVNNLLCFSEPLQPHAWPIAYQLSSGFSGVGLAVYGSSVVMATNGAPFIATGVEPASMSGENWAGTYPCLSKRSVISIGNSVIYASTHGMVELGTQGPGMFTDNFYTKDDWDALNPSTMVCEFSGGRVYVAYDDDAGIKHILVFDGPLLVSVDLEADELYTDPATGLLYIGTDDGILKWDDTTKVVLSGDWKSKELMFPEPVNLGAAKIDFTLAISAEDEAAILAAIAAATATNDALMAASVVTISTANPAVVTWAGNTLQVGDSVVFQTTGALPNGGVEDIVADTEYFVISAGYSAGASFRISATLGGAAIDTSGGSQSGVHTSRSCVNVLGSNNNCMPQDYGINGSALVYVPESPPSNLVTFILYHGESLLVSRVVRNTRAFRLPAGYKHDNFSVEVITQCKVREIRIAETMDGLRAA